MLNLFFWSVLAWPMAFVRTRLFLVFTRLYDSGGIGKPELKYAIDHILESDAVRFQVAINVRIMRRAGHRSEALEIIRTRSKSIRTLNEIASP